jgi:hypothetical protein
VLCEGLDLATLARGSAPVPERGQDLILRPPRFLPLDAPPVRLLRE